MHLLYQFGPGSGQLKQYDLNEDHLEKVTKLSKIAGAPQIMAVARHYLLNFIPTPFEHENIYWMATCFPSTDKSAIRFTIYWHEVLNIHMSNETVGKSNSWNVMVFIDNNFIDNSIKSDLEKRIPALRFDKDFRYNKGLKSQLAVRVPLTSYFDLVADEHIYESIRQYNFQLSCKGKTVHKSHNYDLVRTMLKSTDPG